MRLHPEVISLVCNVFIGLSNASQTVKFRFFFITFNWELGTTNPMNFISPLLCERAPQEAEETPDTIFAAFGSRAKNTNPVEQTSG